MRRRRADPKPVVSILRIGHRPGRDPRLTTHLALAARALGADRLFLHPADPELAERVHAVRERWGGDFEVVGVDNWRKLLRSFDRNSIHLTMYGQPLDRVERRWQKLARLLLVVGGPKVPSDLFHLARWNVAVGHQPHSEVAAVAVVLARLRGLPPPRSWPGAHQRIVPLARGKRVIALRRRGER